MSAVPVTARAQALAATAKARGLPAPLSAPSVLLSVVLVPDAVVVGHARSASLFEENVCSIERQLVTSEWLAERCCKVVFTDSAEPALSDLAAENVVLAARGSGWAPSAGRAAQLDMDEFLGRLRATGRAPRLVFLVLKYGARDA